MRGQTVEGIGISHELAHSGEVTENVIIQGKLDPDATIPKLYIISKAVYDNEFATLPLAVREGTLVRDYDIADGDNSVYYFRSAATVPLIADVYNKPDLWTSITGSFSQSMMQSMLNGLSLGWPQSFSGKSITGADWANYTSNLHSYIRGAANGISIMGSALTSAHLRTAGTDILTTLSKVPAVADSLGLKYMKFVRIVNSASPQWVHATFEYAPPMLNQRVFMPYDRHLGMRTLSHDAIGINDFRSINDLDR